MEYIRLGYRQKFVPKKFILKYGSEKIKNLSVMIKYRLYSKKTGLEILFEKNKNYIIDQLRILPKSSYYINIIFLIFFFIIYI